MFTNLTVDPFSLIFLKIDLKMSSHVSSFNAVMDIYHIKLTLTKCVNHKWLINFNTW